MPVLLTVAIVALLLLHVPPAIASVKVVVEPAVTDDAPDMVPAVGNGLTVTAAVVLQPPAVV